jgi:hypothetical protein
MFRVAQARLNLLAGLVLLACGAEPFDGKFPDAGADVTIEHPQADAPSDAPPEATVKEADAEPCGVIAVQSAVYATSCGASTELPTIASECDGLSDCSYVMLMAKDPGSDVSPGCWKDLHVAFDCGDDAGSRSLYLPETWDNLVVHLSCCKE